jgi:hypothetical protein
MPRTKRTIAGVHKKVGQAKPGIEPGMRDGPPLTKRELIGAVCRYFCKGHSATEIAALMKREHGIEMKREKPYELVSYAASKGWLRYVAPTGVALRERLLDEYRWLKTGEVKVVDTSVYDDVAYHGAEMLIELLKRRRLAPGKKKEIHVGFAGGGAMRKLARAAADLLHEPTEGLPQTMVAHALCGSFDNAEPSKAPSAFFTWFLKDATLQLETRFVGFQGPPMIKNGQLGRQLPLRALNRKDFELPPLDLIVTSASCWADEHCSLSKMTAGYPKTLERLEEAGCIGDMLWQTLARTGWLEDVPAEIRAFSLVRLSQLPGLIDQGTRVLLVIGPCGHCFRPKGAILATILGLDEHLITDLVVDSRAVSQTLGFASSAA